VTELATVARSAVDALNRGDIEGYLEWMHPEVEFTSLIAEAEGETYKGHDGVRRWWRDVRGAFDQVNWEYLDIQGDHERGVAAIRIEGVLGGVEVSQTMWQAVRMREGKAAWWAFFRSEADALDAVGLAQ
jgi:hypothetical protein